MSHIARKLASQPPKVATLEDFLSWEARGDVRVEYRQGQMWAMSGGTRAHNAMISELQGRLWAHLRGQACDVFSSGMKVVVEEVEAAYYPDIVVDCSSQSEANDIILTAPTVIIEVFSDSTEGRDRGRKWEDYARIDELREYVLVNPVVASVVVKRRAGLSSEWRTQVLGLEDQVVLASIGFECPVRELYPAGLS